jgi:hypothetical protein
MGNRRKSGFFSGALTSIVDINGLHFLDLAAEFINAHLEVISEGQQRAPGLLAASSSMKITETAISQP